jgi:hypothetical protein
MRYVCHTKEGDNRVHDYEKAVSPYVFKDADVYRVLDALNEEGRIIVCAPGDFEQVRLCVRTHRLSMKIGRQVRMSLLLRLGSYQVLGMRGRRVRCSGRWKPCEERPEYCKPQSGGGTASAPTELNT